MVNIFLNKYEIENKNINLVFEEIKSFKELIRWLKWDSDEVVYIRDINSKGHWYGICGQKLQLKYTWLHKHPYVLLNDSIIESTKITEYNFDLVDYKFYRVTVKKW